jgi:hypothetical protein
MTVGPTRRTMNKRWVIQTLVNAEHDEGATIAHFCFEMDAKSFAKWANEGVQRRVSTHTGEAGSGHWGATKFRAIQEDVK